MLTCLNPLNSVIYIYIYVVYSCDSVSKWPFGVFVSRSWTEVGLHLRQGRCTCGHGISEPIGFLGDGPWASGCWIRKELYSIYFNMPWCWNQWCENTSAVPDGTIKNTKTSFRRNPPNVWWRHILFGNWRLQISLDKSAKFGLVSKLVFYAFPKVKAKRWRKEVKRVPSLRAVHGMPPFLSLGAVDTPAVSFGSKTPYYYLRLAWSCQMNTLHMYI